jgi:hypothetical protein
MQFTSTVIDATGEKIAFLGQVWNKDRATKNLTKVGFRFGTVTKASGSALTVSLQNVATAGGLPYQPDEVQDQTVAIANGDSGFTSNVWYQTGAFSASRSVAFGELLAVVVEFDGSGRLGSDAVNFHAFGLAATTVVNEVTGTVLKTASWATVAVSTNIVLEFDDGTFGCLAGNSQIASAQSAAAYNSGSGFDELALEFQVPFACKIDGCWIRMRVAGSTSDFDVVLYDSGGGTLASVAVDAMQLAISGTNDRIATFTFAETELAINTTYRLSIKPTSGNNVTLYYREVANANHKQAMPGGTAWNYTTRVDGGSWAAATTTRVPEMGIRISALSDSATAGAGGYPASRVRLGM